MYHFDADVPVYLRNPFTGKYSPGSLSWAHGSSTCREEAAFELVEDLKLVWQDFMLENECSIWDNMVVPEFSSPPGKKQKASVITISDFEDDIEEGQDEKLEVALDLVLAPLAYLIGGPKAFIPKGEVGVDYFQVQYKRLSGFWAGSAALCSLFLGQLRYVIKTCEERKLDTILDKYNVRSTLAFYKRLHGKQDFSEKERQKLLALLKKQRPLFQAKRVKDYPVEYPVNPYTWAMFIRVVKKPELFFKAPKAKGINSIYGASYNGFLRWLSLQPKPTKMFASLKKKL